MSNENALPARMTLDLKHNRFRMSTQTLHYLGNPSYIQYLINPEELYIVILCADSPIASKTAKKIYLRKYHGCVEFYSTAFLDSLIKIFGKLDYQCSYRLFGEIDQVNHVAYFSLSTLRKNER